MFAPGVGRPLVGGAVALAVVSALGGADLLPRTFALIALILAGWAVWAFLALFFRDPERAPGEGIVSPADGRVREVGQNADTLLVSIFMNVYDVHVNRFPIDAKVERVEEAGKGFRPAYAAGAAHNVRRAYHLTTAVGPVELTQLTGAFARRLVSFVGSGDERKKGDRLGMIVLGSRVDVLLPADRVYPTVVPGGRVRAGETTIARVKP